MSGPSHTESKVQNNKEGFSAVQWLRIQLAMQDTGSIPGQEGPRAAELLSLGITIH